MFRKRDHVPFWVEVLLFITIANLAVVAVASIARAATVEVQVNAARDGYARLHTEGLWLEGCQMQTGPCELRPSEGRPTTRRVRVHKGTNRIRLKAFRWEDMDVFEYVAKYPPEARPAAWPVVSAPLNWVYVYGRVAGSEIEPIEMKL